MRDIFSSIVDSGGTKLPASDDHIGHASPPTGFLDAVGLDADGGYSQSPTAITCSDRRFGDAGSTI